MNYYNLRGRNLISDILAPFNKGGYDIKHQGVQRQPIGLLHNRYLRRPYYLSRAKNQVANSRTYTFVPPMISLRQDPRRSALMRKILKIAAAAGLILFNARLSIVKLMRALKHSLSGWAYGIYRAPSRLKLAVPALLVIFGLLWLAHILPSTYPGKSSPTPAQLIPVRPAAVSNQGSSGGSGSSANSGANTPQSSQSAGVSVLSPASGVQNASAVPVGGMGGGPGTTTGSGTSTTSPTSSSGLLPLTLTVPPTSTGVDNKTILDTSGTTLTVN